MPKRRRDEVREHVWESHKPFILQLYMNERKPLHEVMATMKRHGFCAT